MDVNKVILVGRLGKDPEGKFTSGGKQLATFSVATSYGAGENRQTEWHNVTAWEKQAEFAIKYLHKGDLVYVEGRIQTNTVEKDGDTKRYVGIVATAVNALVSNGSKNTEATAATVAAAAPAPEDIPF